MAIGKVLPCSHNASLVSTSYNIHSCLFQSEGKLCSILMMVINSQSFKCGPLQPYPHGGWAVMGLIKYFCCQIWDNPVSCGAVGNLSTDMLEVRGSFLDFCTRLQSFSVSIPFLCLNKLSCKLETVTPGLGRWLSLPALVPLCWALEFQVCGLGWKSNYIY